MTSDHDEMRRVYGAVGKEHTAQERQQEVIDQNRHLVLGAARTLAAEFKGYPAAWLDVSERIANYTVNNLPPDDAFDHDICEIYDRAKVGR